jgi:hypothetical protein
MSVGLPALAASYLPTIGLAGKRFVDQLVSGSFAAATERFDATMRAALPPAKLSAIWRDLEAKLGAFQRVSNVRTETVAGHVDARPIADISRWIIGTRRSPR